MAISKSKNESSGIAKGSSEDRPRDLYANLVPIVRTMLGLVFAVNGLNWWFKMIDPYPSMSDYAHRPPSMTFVGAMIRTGILFHLVKAIELLSGIALLSNRFVALALVAALPVTINVFIVDVFMSAHLRAHIMGGGALIMSVFLMFAYLNYYRPMLVEHARFDAAPGSTADPSWPQLNGFDPRTSPAARRAMIAFGLAASAIGLVMLIWLAVMIEAHFAAALQGRAPAPAVGG